MISNLEDYTDFLCRHDMSAEQFLFCCLIYEKKYSLVYKLFNERGGFHPNEVLDLVERGYVIDNNDTEIHPDLYEITKKFTKDIYDDQNMMWKEFIDLYPKFIFINQNRIPAQSCDLDQLKLIYFSKIGSVVQHNRILKNLQFAVDNDMISMGVEKWIKSEQWKVVESLMSEKLAPKYGEREF